MTAIFEVDFIFCCPCFFSGIFHARFMVYKTFFEYTCLVHRRNSNKTFDVDNFRKDASMLITCFEHLYVAMHFDTVEWLHYNRSTFYRVVVDNSIYPKRKCYHCYRKSVKKLLKHFP